MGKAIDLKPEIEKILAKREREFTLDERAASRVSGEEGVKLVDDLRNEFWRIQSHLVSYADSIEGEDAEELRELIANKLVVGAKTAASDDWWWTAPKPQTAKVLREVHQLLESATAKKKHTWHRVLRYSWKVILEFVYLAIVLGVFSVATTKFETVVIAILVLIYNRAKGLGTGIGISFAYLAAGMERMYGDLGRSMQLKIPTLPEREADKRMTKVGIEMFIHAISIGLGSLIALWKIADAVSF